MIRVVFVGAGNLATQLSRAMVNVGMQIMQVYSHTKTSAEKLAVELGCPFTTDPKQVTAEADLYVFALKDKFLAEIIAAVPTNDALWVHTAGSMPISLFEGKVKHYGSFYPLQTFSKERKVDFSVIPIFVESKDAKDERSLLKIAKRLTDKVSPLSFEKRSKLHLAAVFACNFVNHCYALTQEMLQKEGVAFDVMLPLIEETTNKLSELSPKEAQTGPAIRYDENVINHHIDMIEEDLTKNIYRLMSQSIHQLAKKK